MTFPLTRSRSRARFFGTPFSPVSLFANGEQGAWYDPSDLTTLFQDAAGTTPTVMETRARLMLDKSKGLVLGPELVTNGDFSSSSGWTLPGTGTNSITGGQAVLSGAAGYLFRTGTSITAAHWYRVSFTVSGYSGSGTVRPYIQASPVFGSNVTGNGVFVQYLLATTTSANTEVGLNFASFTGNVDDLSIKAIAGNHATAPSDASSPILRARYNLLTWSEDFSNAAWQKAGAVVPVVTANQGTAPDGTNTADRVVMTSPTAGTRLQQDITFTAANHTYTVYARSNTGSAQTISLVKFDGTETSSGNLTVPTTWTLLTYTFTAAAGVGSVQVRAGSGLANVDVLLWGADLRTSADAALNIPAYQSITTATSYDTAGFPPYLAFDGTDDSFSTASIDFTGTDKMTVFAGVTKLSDAAIGILYELSADWNSNSGSMLAAAPNITGASGDYSSGSRGTAGVNANQVATSAITLAPVTNVFTATHDIPGDLSTIRLNGAASGTNGTGDKGTGNFGNYPLFIGRRNNSSLPFNGRIYSLIIRGASTTTPLIASTEQWVAGKMRLPI